MAARASYCTSPSGSVRLSVRVTDPHRHTYDIASYTVHDPEATHPRCTSSSEDGSGTPIRHRASDPGQHTCGCLYLPYRCTRCSPVFVSRTTVPEPLSFVGCLSSRCVRLRLPIASISQPLPPCPMPSQAVTSHVPARQYSYCRPNRRPPHVSPRPTAHESARSCSPNLVEGRDCTSNQGPHRCQRRRRYHRRRAASAAGSAAGRQAACMTYPTRGARGATPGLTSC